MTDKLSGRIICGVGGLYTVLCDGGKILKCKARGVLRIKKITPLAGDRVTVRRGDGDEMGFFIDSIFPRKTVLDRPPVANINTVFTVLCPAEPEPSLLGTDKLLCAISAAKITPVVIISKADIAPEKAKALFDIYSKGYKVFLTSSELGEGIGELRRFISENTTICAFAGASGVGKSTLLNALFPDLSLKTGKISEKSQRGKHTTREVTLFPFGDDKFIADTPGFSRLDLDAVEYFPPEELFFCFPEFEKYFGKCKYKGCTHLREEGCAVISAVECGDIPLSRHESYVTMYEELKNNPRW